MNWQWLTGFYEGEGCAGCYKFTRRNKYKLVAQLAQSNKNILLKIKDFLKVSNIWKGRKTLAGSQMYHLTLQSAKARWFLNKILPYCQHPCKIKQIKKALQLDKKYVKPQRRK